jgi:glycerophosphoryl diester phosphodiesterase
MKKLKKVIIILLIILSVGLILALAPKPKFERVNPFISTTGVPLVMAHAGGQADYPGNTMAAFKHSFNLGVDILEMDVQMTKDNVLVLLHGQNTTGNTIGNSNCDTVVWDEDYDYLNQTCNFGYQWEDKNGDYPYRDMTESQWHDADVYLPTLEELFQTFGKDTLYNIEIKADADAPRTKTADALYNLIHEYDLEDYVLVACAFNDIGSYLIENYPTLFVSTSYDATQKLVIPIYTLTSVFHSRPKYAAIQVPTSYSLPVIGNLRLDTAMLIKTLHQQNLAINYWTIDDEETMRFLIKQKADGIITDNPELLMSIIAENETN